MTRVKDNSAFDFLLPQVLVEASLRQQGIILIVGNRNSSIEKTLDLLGQKWKEKKINSMTYVTRDGSPTLGKNGFHICTYDNILESNHRLAVKESSVVIFENIQFEDELSHAINLYEDGRLVVLHLSAPSLISALHRLFGLAMPTQNPHLLWRLIDGLAVMFSQTQISNAQSEFVLANEIVLASSEVKKILWSKDLTEFEELMKNAGEHSGIVTMNQSLLQLLVKRRIEIKTAFEVSRDPVDLDHLLKRVGV
ncbi:MAG: hypothetical protein AABY64_13690 [Bdellovibrionota bacterium]